MYTDEKTKALKLIQSTPHIREYLHKYAPKVLKKVIEATEGDIKKTRYLSENELPEDLKERIRYFKNMSNFFSKQQCYPLWECEYDERSILCTSCPDKSFCEMLIEEKDKRNIYE